MGEKVLVAPREILFSRLGYFQGFRPAGESAEEDLRFIRDHGVFRARAEVEDDPDYQQIIPYVTVFSTAGEIFVFRRTRAGGEQRLHDLYSIGIGGHINPSDQSGDLILSGLRREFNEEMEADSEPGFEFWGWLNGDELPVDKVHFGLVFRTTIKPLSVRVREHDKMTGRFLAPELARTLLPKMEGWSAMLLPAALESLGV